MTPSSLSLELARALLALWRSPSPPPVEAIEAPARQMQEALELPLQSIRIRRKVALKRDGTIDYPLRSEEYREEGYLLARLPRLSEGGPHPSRELWLLSQSDRLLYLRAGDERIERDPSEEYLIRIWQAPPLIMTESRVQGESIWPEIRQILAWLVLPAALEAGSELFPTEVAAVAFFQEVIRDTGLIYALQFNGISLKNALPRTLRHIRSPKAIAGIAELLSHPEAVVRRIVVGVLTGLGADHALGPLIQALKDPDKGIRQEALMALQGYDGPEILDAIRRLLGDGSWWLRAQAARLLGRRGGEEDIMPLKALWEDNDPEDIRHAVASAAQEAVIKIRERLPQVAQDEEDHLQAGIEALKARDLPSAIAHLREAIAANPDNPLAYSYLGAACIQSEKLAEALRAFEKAVELSPNSSAHHYNLGVAYQRLGRIYEARTAFQNASRLGHPRALQNLRDLSPQTSFRAF